MEHTTKTLKMVAAFQEAFDAGCPREPHLPPAPVTLGPLAADMATLAKRLHASAQLGRAEDGGLLLLRLQLIQEELAELAEAMAEGDTTPPNTPNTCLLYTSPRPRDRTRSRMPSSA